MCGIQTDTPEIRLGRTRETELTCTGRCEARPSAGSRWCAPPCAAPSTSCRRRSTPLAQTAAALHSSYSIRVRTYIVNLSSINWESAHGSRSPWSSRASGRSPPPRGTTRHSPSARGRAGRCSGRRSRKCTKLENEKFRRNKDACMYTRGKSNPILR